MARNTDSLPDGTYFTTGSNYTGLSQTHRQYGVVNPKTGFKSSLVPISEIMRHKPVQRRRS